MEKVKVTPSKPQWTSITDHKPKHFSLVWGICDKGWMDPVRCTYYEDVDAFVYHHPTTHESMVLDITHWCYMPERIKFR